MPGLRRILLIDTHLPGVVELKLDGHTNICGTNASGKTTLQRLIPVFYGERPSQVVPATRDSFEKWYLPRESSYIIYEFARFDDQLCQAVLTSSGTGVQYRFISKPFELSDYLFKTQTGQGQPVTPKELSRGFKRNNILLSKLLNTKEFRAVIQNDRSILQSSSDSRELQGYASVFSLCQSGGQLRHIEKLAKAVHSKEGKMETIKAMIAAILEEDGVQQPASHLNRNRVEDWIRECHLIKNFDGIRPEFTKLEQAELQLTSNEQRLAELKVLAQHDLSRLAATLLTEQANVEAAQASLRQTDNQWNKERDQLNQQLSAARADADKYETDLEKIEQEYQRWQDNNIDQLQQNLQQLPQWQSQLLSLDDRYALLTDKHQDIESTYNKRLAALSEKLNEDLSLFDQKRSELSDALGKDRQQQQMQLQQIQTDYQQQQQKVTEDFQQQLTDLKVRQAKLSTAMSNAGFSEFEQSQLDLQDAKIKQESQQEDAARDTLRRAQQAHQQARQQQSDASRALDQASRHQQQRQQQVNEIEALLYPGNGSLLEYLRQHKTGWEQSLGKVLRPELLQQRDLKPEDRDDSQLLFGLALDLSSVDVPDYADSEHALQNRLQDAQQQLGEAIKAHNQAELALAQATEQVRNTELAYSQCESQCKTVEANRKRAQQDKEQLHSEYSQALAERKQQHKKQLKQNQQEQEKCRAQRQLAIQQVQEQQGEALTECEFHWQQLIEDKQQQLSSVNRQIEQLKAQAKQDKQKTQDWLNNELDKRGVDVDEIDQLQQQIKQLKHDIQHAEHHRNDVRDYQHWYKSVYNGQKVKWQQALAKAKQEISECERDLNKRNQQFMQTRDTLKGQQRNAEQALKTAKEHESGVNMLLSELKRISLPKTASAQNDSGDAATLPQRLSEGQDLLKQRSELLDDIKAYVDHFDKLIAAQAGTGLSDTWERAREECSMVSNQGIRSLDHRRMVGHLAQLLNVIVPQKLQGLREQGRIFGNDLSQYYKVLEDIDKRIVSQSKRISKEVDEELYLEGVSDSAVKIRSKISELEFWPELIQFNQLYDEWMQSGANSLPDDDYAQSMRRVMDILGRAALAGGISKLLDIELHLREGDSNLVIRTDRALNESSSHGMAYLILCKFLLAFTRLLRGNVNAIVHWPIDELGTLHQSNVKKIFDACQNNQISVVGAFPNPESEVLSLFDNRYLIDKASRKLQVVQPKVSAISARLQARKQQEQPHAE